LFRVRLSGLGLLEGTPAVLRVDSVGPNLLLLDRQIRCELL